MSTPGTEPTEEELRAAYEAELSRIRVEHVLLEQVVTLVNLGMRRTGLAPGTETERDPAQVALAIDSLRALMPVLERAAPEQVGPIRQALSQLQLAFVRIGGPPPAGVEGAGAGSAPAGSGPGAQPTGPAAQPEGPGAQPGGPGAPPAGPGAAGAGAPPPPGGAGAPATPEPPKPGEPGPAQRSGRLWVPGQ